MYILKSISFFVIESRPFYSLYRNYLAQGLGEIILAYLISRHVFIQVTLIQI